MVSAETTELTKLMPILIGVCIFVKKIVDDSWLQILILFSLLHLLLLLFFFPPPSPLPISSFLPLFLLFFLFFLLSYGHAFSTAAVVSGGNVSPLVDMIEVSRGIETLNIISLHSFSVFPSSLSHPLSLPTPSHLPSPLPLPPSLPPSSSSVTPSP